MKVGRLALIVVLVASACSDPPEATPPDPVLQSLEITPATASLAPGDQATFAAIAHYDNGTTLDVTTDPSTMWATESSSVLTIDAAGTASAIGAGMTTVSAEHAGLVGFATITVANAPALVGIELAPSAMILHSVGEVVTFTVTGTYDDGSTANVTADATLTSSDPSSLALTGSSGTRVSSAEHAGVIVTARAGAFAAQTRIILIAAIGTASLNAVIDYTDCEAANVAAAFPIEAAIPIQVTATPTSGPVIDLDVVDSMTSSAPTIVSVPDPHVPIAHAKTVGTATLTVVVGGQQRTMTVEVQALTLQSIALTGPTSLNLGVTWQYQAFGTYPEGTCDLARRATWSASPTTRGTVDAGRFVATSMTANAGQVTLSATAGGITGVTQVTVAGTCARTFELRPLGPVMFPLGRQAELTAVVTMTDGSEISVAPTSFTSSPTGLNASNISSNGNAFVRISATGTGAYNFTARLGAGVYICPDTPNNYLEATVPVTVQSATLDAITVQCGDRGVLRTFDGGDLSMPAGLEEQCVAIGYFSDGNSDVINQLVSWSSVAPTIAEVDNASRKGIVTARAPGTTVIVATLGAVSDATSLRVNTATLSMLTAMPLATTHRRIATPFEADAQFRIGLTGPAHTYWVESIANQTSPVTCTSANTALATVTCPAEGWKVVGVAPGTTNINVTFMGTTATVAATVDAATISSVAVYLQGTTATSGSHPAGIDVNLQAFAVYPDAQSFEVTAEATWSSQNTAVVQVQSPGVVRGVAAGTTQVLATFGGINGTYGFTTQ